MEDINNAQVVAFGRGALLSLNHVDDAERFRSSVLAMRATGPADVLEWIDGHLPDDPAVRESDEAMLFVRDVVLCTEPQNEHSASLIFVAVSGLVSWAHLGEGLPLIRSVLFHQSLTDIYLAQLLTQGRAVGTVRNYRGYLQRAATALGVVASTQPTPISGRAVAAPYSAEAERRFGGWARGLVGDLNSARGFALLGLAAGAGLRDREIHKIRARDIIDEAGMWIRVSGNGGRLTPVREEWAPYVRRAIESLSPDDFIFPKGESSSPTLVKEWIKRCPGRGRPVPGRLRATWLVANLRAEVRPEALLVWSGIERGETISHYLAFLPGATEHLRRAYVVLRTPNFRGVNA